MNTITRLAVAAVPILAAAPSALAGHNYWSGGSAFSSNWSDSLNWRNIDGPGTTERQNVWFQGASARTTSTVNQDYELQALQFDYDTVNVTSSFTVNRSNNARLKVVDGVNNRTTSTQTVNVPVIFLESGQITNSYQGTSGGRLNMGDIGTNGKSIGINPSMSGIILNGGIYDNGSINVNGPGTVSPTAQSYWTGGLYLTNGAVSYYASNQLGPNSNPIIFNNDNGTYSLLSSYVSLTNAHPVEFRTNEGRISTDVGNVTTYSGTFTGAGDMAKHGSGTLVLSGASTRTGRTFVREGTLRVSGAATLPDTLLDIAGSAVVTYPDNGNDRVGALSGAGTLNLGINTVWGVGNPGAADGGGAFSGSITGSNVVINKQGSGTLVLSGSSSFSGYLDVYDGTLVVNNTGNTSATGSAEVTVLSNIRGDGRIAGTLDLWPGATLSPSFAGIDMPQTLGSFEIGGVLLHRPDSVLDITLSSGGGSDLITVNGAAALDGTLALSLVLNQPLTSGTPRQIMQVDGDITTRFRKITGMAMSNGKSLAVTYTAHGVFVRAATPGDANLDGAVNFDDLLVLAQNYSPDATGRTWSMADFNGDTLANFDDLLTLAQHYGVGALSSGEADLLGSSFASDWALARSLAPEPGSLAILALAANVRRRR